MNSAEFLYFPGLAGLFFFPLKLAILLHSEMKADKAPESFIPSVPPEFFKTMQLDT